MPIVADKPISVVYNAGDLSVRTTVVIGLESPIATEHIVSLLFDDIYVQWFYAGLPIHGWNNFAFPLSNSTETFEVRFRMDPTGVDLPPMPYVVSSTYAPNWAKVQGYIDIVPVEPTITTSWLYAWLRPWKIFGV